MTDTSPGMVTRLLAEVRNGDRAALADILPIVYDQLRQLAHRQRGNWRGNSTLGTTALVHEAYLKLLDTERIGAESRAHFLRIASTAMRQILCNYARDRRAAKRGGDAPILSLEALGDASDALAVSSDQSELLPELDDALHRLELVDVRLAAVVECRFFGGLSIEETAEALGTSPATVKRDWALARAWLFRELRREVAG